MSGGVLRVDTHSDRLGSHNRADSGWPASVLTAVVRGEACGCTENGHSFEMVSSTPSRPGSFIIQPTRIMQGTVCELRR